MQPSSSSLLPPNLQVPMNYRQQVLQTISQFSSIPPSILQSSNWENRNFIPKKGWEVATSLNYSHNPVSPTRNVSSETILLKEFTKRTVCLFGNEQYLKQLLTKTQIVILLELHIILTSLELQLGVWWAMPELKNLLFQQEFQLTLPVISFQN